MLKKEKPLFALEPLLTIPGATKCQRLNSLLFELLKPLESEFWKPVEKSSIWTNSLSKLHSDKTPCCFKDHETPERLSNTEALQVLPNPTLNLMSDPAAGNSNEHEVDELPEVTKSKFDQKLFKFKFFKLSSSIVCKFFLS